MVGQSRNDDTIKRSRVSHRKVHTGCATCKTRRVKCDETKPSCTRCIKFGQVCDGYAQPRKKTQKFSPVVALSPRLLVPKVNISTAASSPTSTVSSSPDTAVSQKAPLLPAPIESSPFRTGDECRAFQRFCNKTVAKFEKNAWSHLMYRLYNTSPSIRHAIISTGSLPLSNLSQDIGTLRHQVLFNSYKHSRYMHPTHDIHSTLIACLLFNCFESFHGYHECAIKQVKEGLREIGDCVDADAESLDELLKKLDEQAVQYSNTRNAEIHELYRKCGQESIDVMPRQFSTLAEARILLEIIIRRSVHWLASTVHLHDFSEALEPWSLFDVNPSAKEKKKTLHEFERWRQAYGPLLEAEKKTGRGESFVLAMALRLHWLAGYLTVASNASDISLDSGRFVAELEELVSVSGILLVEAMKAEKPYNFAFDVQVIVPLTTVGWIYRHRALRRNVIALLRQSPRREGVWDGVVMGKVLAWLAREEEEGLVDSEYVPEHATARMIRMRFDAKSKVAHVSCFKPVQGPGCEKTTKVEIKIPW